MTADAASLVSRALTSDRQAIAKLISLVEAGGDAAREAIALLHPETGAAWSVGITGAPGAGKSTLTDRMVAHIRAADERVGVLAVDPTSPFSGGAILGDRVRMQGHATDPGVFIRSMATRGHLGGLAVAVPQAARVLDAAGMPWILIETVGVGQVEVEIAAQADTTIVVVNPGWGDAVQAAKAGLMEVADIFVVNKADRSGSAETASDLEAMLSLAGAQSWRPPVVLTVATEGAGVEELLESVALHREHLVGTGLLAGRRTERLRDEMRTIVAERLSEQAAALSGGERFEELLRRVGDRECDPFTAVDELLAQ
ncbi:MAG: methylmalonyl Co-A mutase-associated GTPase MeaB [Acidimicrobiia bacterium]|nr:methylmalonyl Co-A mutase-associated GTPase MeaB [Acidimicrobiia bacterium]